MTMNLESLPPVSEMMRECGLEPKKQFGQNFLFDLNLTGRIARSVPDIKKIPVVEVGPGPAGLTRALLLAGARRVIAIEKDKTTILIGNEILLNLIIVKENLVDIKILEIFIKNVISGYD